MFKSTLMSNVLYLTIHLSMRNSDLNINRTFKKPSE